MARQCIKLIGDGESLSVRVHCVFEEPCCCGSAGTYSILHSELSYKLRDQKLAAIEATGADTIASANIGCLTHLLSGTAKPVRRWTESVDSLIRE